MRCQLDHDSKTPRKLEWLQETCVDSADGCRLLTSTRQTAERMRRPAPTTIEIAVHPATRLRAARRTQESKTAPCLHAQPDRAQLKPPDSDWPCRAFWPRLPHQSGSRLFFVVPRCWDHQKWHVPEPSWRAIHPAAHRPNDKASANAQRPRAFSPGGCTKKPTADGRPQPVGPWRELSDRVFLPRQNVQAAWTSQQPALKQVNPPVDDPREWPPTIRPHSQARRDLPAHLPGEKGLRNLQDLTPEHAAIQESLSLSAPNATSDLLPSTRLRD